MEEAAGLRAAGMRGKQEGGKAREKDFGVLCSRPCGSRGWFRDLIP